MKEHLEQHVKHVKEAHELCQGEAVTKQSLIAPLFTILGYNMADPRECIPEYKAPFGKDRFRQPVDWAFCQNGQPIFLVEAKDAGTILAGHEKQLASYFATVPGVKLGILTNGVMWWFFSDIKDVHLMDTEPFFEWDVLNDQDPPYAFLELLQKTHFKTEDIRKFAERRYKHNLMVKEVVRLLEQPSDAFTRLAIANIENRTRPSR
jgi:hypothetical protein